MTAALINTDLHICVFTVWHSHSTFHKNEGWTTHSAVGVICSIPYGLWPVKLAEIRLRSAWKVEFACCPLIMKQSIKYKDWIFPTFNPQLLWCVHLYQMYLISRKSWVSPLRSSHRIFKNRKRSANQWRPFVAGQTSGSKASICLMKTPQSGQLFISIGWSVGG